MKGNHKISFLSDLCLASYQTAKFIINSRAKTYSGTSASIAAKRHESTLAQRGLSEEERTRRAAIVENSEIM